MRQVMTRSRGRRHPGSVFQPKAAANRDPEPIHYPRRARKRPARYGTQQS